jgi:signal peptidase I
MRRGDVILTAVAVGVTATLAVLRLVFYQPFDAPSVSMTPTINEGDYFLVSLQAYSGHDPERGDVIVFHSPKGPFVKRIAGIPGDQVQMSGGRFVLNGKAVMRRQVEDFSIEDFDGKMRAVKQYSETLPSGRSYRTLDIIDGSGFDDTQVFVVPPDHYFVMGDNRDNSDDSRGSEGFIARGDIVGRVAFKFVDGRSGDLAWSSVQ